MCPVNLFPTPNNLSEINAAQKDKAHTFLKRINAMSDTIQFERIEEDITFAFEVSGERPETADKPGYLPYMMELAFKAPNEALGHYTLA